MSGVVKEVKEICQIDVQSPNVVEDILRAEDVIKSAWEKIEKSIDSIGSELNVADFKKAAKTIGVELMEIIHSIGVYAMAPEQNESADETLFINSIYLNIADLITALDNLLDATQNLDDEEDLSAQGQSFIVLEAVLQTILYVTETILNSAESSVKDLGFSVGIQLKKLLTTVSIALSQVTPLASAVSIEPSEVENSFLSVLNDLDNEVDNILSALHHSVKELNTHASLDDNLNTLNVNVIQLLTVLPSSAVSEALNIVKNQFLLLESESGQLEKAIGAKTSTIPKTAAQVIEYVILVIGSINNIVSLPSENRSDDEGLNEHLVKLSHSIRLLVDAVSRISANLLFDNLEPNTNQSMDTDSVLKESERLVLSVQETVGYLYFFLENVFKSADHLDGLSEKLDDTLRNIALVLKCISEENVPDCDYKGFIPPAVEELVQSAEYLDELSSKLKEAAEYISHIN